MSESITEVELTQPDTGKIDKQIAQLEAESNQLEKRIQKRRKQNTVDGERRHTIHRQISRLKIAKLVNAPDAVKFNYRVPFGCRGYELNDALGTVVEVRRSRATVLFLGKRWNIPLDDLIPADGQQGMFIPL